MSRFYKYIFKGKTVFHFGIGLSPVQYLILISISTLVIISYCTVGLLYKKRRVILITVQVSALRKKVLSNI